MIRYIKGTLFRAEDGSIVVVTGGVGYKDCCLRSYGRSS